MTDPATDSIGQRRFADVGEGAALDQAGQAVHGCQDALAGGRGIRHGVGAAGLLVLGTEQKDDPGRIFHRSWFRSSSFAISIR